MNEIIAWAGLALLLVGALVVATFPFWGTALFIGWMVWYAVRADHPRNR